MRLRDLRMTEIHLAEVRRMLPTLPRATVRHVGILRTETFLIARNAEIPRTATRHMVAPNEALLRLGMLPTTHREVAVHIAAEARRHRGDRTVAARRQEGEADTLPTALLHIARRPAAAEDLMARVVLEDATKRTSLHSRLLPEAAFFINPDTRSS